ncbi:HlyD family secretion protein [Chloroflexota bacterium]
MKRRGIIGILLLGLLIITVTACGGGGGKTTSQQSVEGARGDANVTADGDFSLIAHRLLTFDISGKVAKINVEEGNRVTKGQVLASLDTLALERDLEAARQAVRTAELAIQTAEIDKELAMDNYKKLTYPYDYRTFALDVPTAMALNTDALRELNEAVEIMHELGLSREQYSWEQYWDVWENLKKAQGDLVKARENLIRGYGQDVFQSGILPMDDFWTLRAAQLEVDKAQLALDKANNDMNTAMNGLGRAQDNLEKAVIVAPFDGTVSKIGAKEGEFLSPAAFAGRTIVEIIDLRHMELIVRVDELDVVKVKTGQKVMISVDAIPETKLEGRVTFISPVAREPGVVLFEDEDEEKDYEVKIDFDIPENSPIRAGMSATAEIIIE